MKKFLIEILTFALIYFVLHVMAVCRVGPLVTYYRIGQNGMMFNRIKDIPSHKDPDILFLGSSHTYRGYDTRIFEKAGISSFNFGSSAQTPKQTEVLLKKYLRVINPQAIVLEVNPILFQIDGAESTADLISNDHIDVEICKLALKSGNLKVINTLIYGLYEEYVHHIRESFQEKVVIDDEVYVSGGYVEKRTNASFVPEDAYDDEVIRVRPDQLKSFEKCLRIIKDAGIPYLLVNIPVSKSTYRHFINYEEFDEMMSSYGDYLNFNELMQLDDTCFYDADHLNQKGVELFDERLIQEMDILLSLQTR